MKLFKKFLTTLLTWGLILNVFFIPISSQPNNINSEITITNIGGGLGDGNI